MENKNPQNQVWGRAKTKGVSVSFIRTIPSVLESHQISQKRVD